MAAATNDYGVGVQTVELNLTKTYHGMSICLTNGSIIGRIQEWSPTFAQREGSHIYEINRATAGRPIDYVPGRESGRSISVTRVEVWNDELELAMAEAESEYIDLADQTKPFELVESLFKGTAAYRGWRYKGCWFTSKTLSGLSAEGDFKHVASAEINYVIRSKV